jgi:hypothetical protein
VSAAKTFIGKGEHEGHVVSVVAEDMPHFYETSDGRLLEPGASHSWFECECGEAWEATVGGDHKDT